MTLANYLAHKTCNIIWLKGSREHYQEDPAGAAGIKPGHLLEFYNAAGTRKARVNSTAGGKGLRAFAVEDAFQGLTITDAYASGDPVRYIVCEPGDEVQARLPAAATAVVFGDALVSNGDGTLVKVTASVFSILYSNVAASAAVSNTVTATAFDKSYTFAANALKVGDVVKIRGQGIATATHTTDTLAVAVKIGSTTIFTIPATDVADNDTFEFECSIVIRTIGASGTFVAMGWYNIGTPGTATNRTFFKASTAIDTTVTQAVTVVATWSVADAGNSVRLDVLTAEKNTLALSDVMAFVTKAVDNSVGASETFVEVMVA